MLDKNRIGMSFNRHAADYDSHASVQKRVVARLHQLVLGHLSDPPGSVLDIGCGTGALLSSLRDSYPQARLCGLDLAHSMTLCTRNRLGTNALLVQSDAEELPYQGSSIDLVVSTSTLQWLEDLEAFLKECHRVMTPDALMCVAFFGGSTLWELKECFQSVSEGFDDIQKILLKRMHNFKTRDMVQRSLEQTDFKQVLFMSEIETEHHHDLNELLHSIKKIGAGAHQKSGGGLGWRKILREASNRYREKFQLDGSIPATYEVLYIVARK